MSTPVEQIKERLSIVNVVEQYVKLSKAGKNYRGLSPFKKEKTPSFYVSPDRGMYYCFSTSKGGDIFTFIQEIEGLDFRGALKMLAERAGVELRAEPKQARDERERMFLCLEDATQFFERELEKSLEAKQYIQSRGLEIRTIKRFRIGFVPDGWDNLHRHVHAKGYTDRELERVGLIKRGERGKYYDRFRSRVMFPICDAAGRVVAFSGRVIGKAAENTENAKYLNSPETPLFDKSSVLFGYDKAKQAIRKYNFSIVVEGQMDLVLSHQAGYANTVAASGTGLTEAHLELLHRLSHNVVMAFDADSAGIASAERAARLALMRGMDVKIATILGGKDPADVIKENPDAWKAAIKTASHVVDFALNVVLNQTDDARKRTARVRSEVLPFVASIQNRMDAAHFVSSIAAALSISEEPVWEELKHVRREMSREQPANDVRPQQSDIPQKGPLTRLIYLERQLAGMLLYGQERGADAAISHISDEYVRITAHQLSVSAQSYLSERDALLFEIELAYADDATGEKRAALLREFEHEWIKEESKRLGRQQKEAERLRDDVRARELEASIYELNKRRLALEKK